MLGGGKEKIEIQGEKLDEYKEKSLHGKFYKSTEEERDGESWKWLQKGDLKKGD